MPQLKEVLAQIEELDPVEREELLFVLSESFITLHPLVARWLPTRFPPMEYPSIVSTPKVCGGAARLIRTRIPVWVLERMRQLCVSDVDILRSYPTLRAGDLVQAWSYAARHRAEIEQAIKENEED
jgi:uncharacterized protein (DUF433 family)